MNKIRYNFYTDKVDKKGKSPVHLIFWLNDSKKRNKISLKCKVNKKDMNMDNQPYAKYSGKDNVRINFFLDQITQIINSFEQYNRVIEPSELQIAVENYISQYHNENPEGGINKDKAPKNKFTFIDLFAGAGGFSEGFMQAHTKDKWFDFLLANDIDENCELTHHVRYNHQMGLGSKFLKKNITDHDFIDELKKELIGQEVDVIAGGPPCQSFSLAGRRREFDVKNDLFYHYLKVVRELKPKYFVMENVKGIANKEGGKIKNEILSQIRSIVEDDSFSKVKTFFSTIKRKRNNFLKKNKGITEKIYNSSLIQYQDRYIDSLLDKFEYEISNNPIEKENLRKKLIDNIDNPFKIILREEYVPYQYSKSNSIVNTIRHGLNLLRNQVELEELSSSVIKIKSKANIDNDSFVQPIDTFLRTINISEISKILHSSTKKLQKLIFEEKWMKNGSQRVTNRIDEIIRYLNVYDLSYDGCVDELRKLSKIYRKEFHIEDNFNLLLDEISLYKIADEPLILDSSKYGVPQKRERVVFLGCRNDQKKIDTIPDTIDEAINLEDAIDDLDIKRNSDKISKFAEDSQKGRMPNWYNVGQPFYVKSFSSLKNGEKYIQKDLYPMNSEMSNQTDSVKNRLKIISKKGGYNKSKKLLKKKGLLTAKRNYNLLNPKKPGPTMVTLPDDFIHYNEPRPLTVREMARVQSFDDSFVFQGKRTTGGHRRKLEIPQFTLVGNAVPPLMAKAIAQELLSNISKK